jgi:hypothetical protein
MRNPHYHRESGRIDTLDLAFLAGVWLGSSRVCPRFRTSEQRQCLTQRLEWWEVATPGTEIDAQKATARAFELHPVE